MFFVTWHLLFLLLDSICFLLKSFYFFSLNLTEVDLACFYHGVHCYIYLFNNKYGFIQFVEQWPTAPEVEKGVDCFCPK